MQLEYRNLLTTLKLSLLSHIPDLLIAWGITKYNDDDLYTFILTFFILKVFYLIVWLKNSIWTWIIFYFYSRKILSKVYLDLLKKHNFPKPNYFDNPQEYYSCIIADPDTSKELVVLASAQLERIDSLIECGYFQRSLKHIVSHGDAIHNYYRLFPSDN
jgi:ABC-type multidrug transport system fused ATPase/permease subunit